MKIEDIKKHLSTYRPNHSDANDPDLQEALNEVQRDPQLKQWFEAERQFDQQFSEKLKACPAPDGLRELILDAGQSVLNDSALTDSDRRTPRRFLMVWALAACITLVLLISSWLSRDRLAPSLEGWFTMIAEHSTADMPPPLELGNWAQVKYTLAQKGAPLPIKIPSKIKALPSHGCTVLNYKGALVSLICIDDQKSTHHLYIIATDDLGEVVRIPEPTLKQLENATALTWTDSNQLYMLVIEGSEEVTPDLF